MEGGSGPPHRGNIKVGNSMEENNGGVGERRSEPDTNSGLNIAKITDLLMAVSVRTEENKTRITELAIKAMEELMRMALEGESLWQLEEDGKTETLDETKYIMEFGDHQVDPTLVELMKMVEVRETQCHLNLDNSMASFVESPLKPASDEEIGSENFITEASRETAYVKANPLGIVELLMNWKKWASAFPNIVSRAEILGVISSTAEGNNYDGTLVVMAAEFHMPTPLVPSREIYFVRYCKLLAVGTWGIVDVSLENLFPYPSVKFRRKPSGCLIREIPSEGSQIIWVEHAEVDNRWPHNIFKPLVTSGFAFGAKRWVNSIVRHCERSALFWAASSPSIDGILLPQAGKDSLLKLSERMIRSFCADVSASSANKWMNLSIFGAEEVRFMTRNYVDDPGKPPCPTVVFATSLQISSPPNHVFDFLRHESSRNKWDILSHDLAIQELACVITGNDPGNRVSVIHANAAPNEIAIFYLQRSYRDPTGSYVVYAPMDNFALSKVLNGGNPDCVAILPSGFAVLPEKPPSVQGDESGRSLLTIAFHLIDKVSTKEYVPFESAGTMHKIIAETVASIKHYLQHDRELRCQRSSQNLA